MAGTWLKISMDFCDDSKIKYIRRQPGGDTYIWLWLWILTTAMKKETDTLYLVSGVPYDPETIADEANVKIEDVKQGFLLFEHLKMIESAQDGGIIVLNFHKHQSIAQLQHKRELAKIRKQKQREKQKQELLELDVTRDECDSHATEEKREEESREEKKTNTTQDKPAKNEYPDDFEAVWKEYPRKIEKKDAFNAYKATLKKGVTSGQLLQCVIGYAAQCLRERKADTYIKHGGTFFGKKESWRDFLPEDPQSKNPGFGDAPF